MNQYSKILVTGGCGFIGSNFIVKNIDNNSSHILNYDKLSYAANPNNLISVENFKSQYTFIKGDICNYNNIKKTILEYKPEVIVHFAAESHVDRSISNPMQFVESNVIGTVNLIRASNECINSNKLSKNFKFIHISTDEVYGSLDNTGLFTENSPYKPSSPYSASKAAADHFVNSWVKTFNFPAIMVHASNNFGPFQFPEKLIPHMILNCLNHKSLPIYGDGSNVRDWLYVDDFCNAINLVIKKGIIGETYNVGSNNEKTNLEIVHLICDLLDNLKPSKKLKSYADLISFVKDRPGHDFRYAIDSSKITNKLGFKIENSFAFNMEQTIKWYLENNEWTKNILSGDYKLTRLGLDK